MNIEEFVRESLTQISNAATSVEDKTSGQCVNPIIPVHFDIAVAATDTTGIDGGAKLQVASILQVGGEASKEKRVQEYSRVRFDLGFHIPTKS